MVIPLDRSGSRPLFRQIVDYVRRSIDAGRIAPAAKLPPIRELAGTLGVNRETVADAYRELESLGLTQSSVGRGTFVRERPERLVPAPVEAASPDRPFVPLLSRHATAAAALPSVDFTAPAGAVRLERLVPDPALYPQDEFRRALAQVLGRNGRGLLDYGDPRGHEDMRRVLVERLARWGIETEADALVVTGGSTQAISLALRTFCDPGDAVAVESPTYPGVLSSLTAMGLRAVPVPLADDGMDLPALDALLARGGAKLVYTMPTFQNPTGASASLEHRHALLTVAARHGVPVLEDAFQQDLRFEGRPLPPLRALDRNGQVIHVGTVSKSLFPGLRLGWLVTTPAVARAAVAIKRATDLASSPLLQAALAAFCRSGAYDRHLAKLARELAARHTRAQAALAMHLPPGTVVTRPAGGLAVWVTLPESVDTLSLLPAAKAAGIVYCPGAFFYGDGRRSSALRLTVGAAPPNDLERAIRALGGVVRAVVPSGRRKPAPAERPTVHV